VVTLLDTGIEQQQKRSNPKESLHFGEPETNLKAQIFDLIETKLGSLKRLCYQDSIMCSMQRLAAICSPGYVEIDHY